MNTRVKKSKYDAALAVVSRIIVLIFVIITLYPIIFVCITALKSTSEFFVNVWGFPKKVVWSNFSTAWTTAHIGEYFINSTIVVLFSVIFIIIFGAMAGYALAKLNVPGAAFILALLLSTTMLPSESVIMPLYIMMSKMKLIGNYISLIIPYIGWGLTMTIVIFRGFFLSVPGELLESARVDGCTEAKAFVKVIAPLMLPSIATCAIFNLVGAWGELLWASIALATSSIKTIPLGVLAFKSQFATDWGPLSASIVIVLLPLIIVFLFLQKYFIKGITGGAVKG